jgi:hypothetical protein
MLADATLAIRVAIVGVWLRTAADNTEDDR